MKKLLAKRLATSTFSGSLLNTLLVIGAGICVGISITLLAITFLPAFYPAGFERIQRAGLVPVVLLIAAIQLSASAGWLYVSCTYKKGDNNHE
jgi:hypothetical protein